MRVSLSEWGGEKEKLPSKGNRVKVMDKEMLWSQVLRGRTPGEGRNVKKVKFSWIPETWPRTIGRGGDPDFLAERNLLKCWEGRDFFSSLSSALVRGRSRRLVCDWGINNGENPLCFLSGPLLHGRTARRSFSISIRFDILCESEKQIFWSLKSL